MKACKIDENTYSQYGKWEFNKDITDIFDSHVRKSVPMYDEFHNMIANISKWFVETNSNVYDLGTSTGYCIKNIIDANKDRNVKYIGIDNSRSMVIKAKENLKDFLNVNILEDNITNIEQFENASLITSILTMQFLSIKDRSGVFNTIYKSLNYGGAFVMVEKIITSNSNSNDIYTNLYHDLKLENGLTKEDVINKSQSLRGIMKPITLQDNIKMLKKSGFQKVDTFFQWFNFIGIIAIK